ncbi:Rv3235 family protein [Nesterenkonia alba]|uniref:Rv3235 family protein n=1 Tax=Nesterenkonia alba TaxID=515814 RepID=UPI0003B70343|nr:Rv3235 family protein [Nesterenkonia alba]
MTATVEAPTVEQSSAPAPGRPFRLHREAEVPRMLRRMGHPELAAEASEDTDRQRPVELAGFAEERRQIVAVSRVVCQAALETLAGLRPAHQMQRWCAPAIQQKIAQRAELVHHTVGGRAQPQRVTFLSVRADRVRATVWEVALVFTDGHRARACALRLQAHRRRWQVVAMELG